MITIKKLDEEVTYIRKTTVHTLEINNKEVRVYEYVSDDFISGSSYEYETEIDNADKETLTDDELELLEDNLSDILKLSDNEELELK